MHLRTPHPQTAAELRAHEADTLIAAAREGDPRAFDALVRRFRPRIYALALHLCGSTHDADDITQDAFVQAYRQIAHFEGRSQFFTWLYRITVNRALNVQRGRKRSGVSLDDARVDIAVRVDAPSDPRLALEMRETYATLLSALDALSASLKSAVVLTVLQGLSYEEAAVVLRTSEGAIAVRVHEARKHLRAALAAGVAKRTRASIADTAHKKQAQASDREGSPLSLDLALALAGLL